VGSTVNLYRRLYTYYNIPLLITNKSLIYKALLKYGHSKFSLSVLEFIDKTKLSKDELKKKLLEREQFYIDALDPEYNILKKAGSSLGYKHTPDSLIKMSGENHPLYGDKNLEIRARMSEAKSGENHPLFGKKGENHPLSGKTHTPETLAKMSLAKSGKNNPMSGKSHSAKTLAKISNANGTFIYLYDTQGSLVITFSSARKVGEYFNCTHQTIKRYALNGKIFKEQWILSTSLISKK